jgi:predicted nucleic acid-binding protein
VKAVIDTNVVAYLLLGTEAFVEEARACFETGGHPARLRSLGSRTRQRRVDGRARGVLAPADAPVRLGLARRLGVESVATATLCQGALLRAIESGVSVYDTLFVELATRAACPLMTFDKAILRAFPDVACRPGDLPAR